MQAWLWSIPACPFIGFLVLAVLGKCFARRAVAWIGVGSIALSAVISVAVAVRFLAAPPSGSSWTQTMWMWMHVSGFRPEIAFYLDPLSLVMTVVVTGVGFFIHLYSAEFMSGDEGYSRFFAYMNLFVASMVTLVLADNLLLLYLGWEGVGLCSYLLIGFWYSDPANGLAARKAFIVTRVGDISMFVGILLLFTQFGTLQIQQLMDQAVAMWPVGSPYAVAAALLLLGGAIAKSAQLPLQTWLPDAMAGPTPTSALIHAATMVTAGVYLIARTHALFEIAPQAQFAVAVIGAVTLLVSGFSALTQRDIKRVLAYSTISQIGYMFLALGVGAWSAAIFHFVTHAFFKALLFLAAGIVIQALHHEHDIFRMGGLKKTLPVAFWTFLIGGCSLAGLPLITAGFYSKGLIIWESLASEKGSAALWAAAVAGVLLTALYTFRLIFIVFFGQAKTEVGHRPGARIGIAVIVLAFLSLVAGFADTPAALGNVHLFSNLMSRVFPPVIERSGVGLGEGGSEGFVTLAFIAGLAAAYLFFLKRPDYSAAVTRHAVCRALHAFWLADWGFDWLYERVFVRPVLWVARINKNDFADAVYTGIARANELSHRALRLTETGKVRWYAAGIAAGSVIFLAIAMLT